jgi:chromosomal replication initiator protein
MEQIWSQIQKNLEKRLKAGIFQVWVKPLQGAFEDGTLYITAPNEFVASWVRERLGEEFQNVGADLLGFVPQVSIQAQKNNGNASSLPTMTASQNTPGHLPVTCAREHEPGFAWKFSFADFEVGDCNQLAYAACTSLCHKNLPADFIFLCASPGLGKTHLLQAIGHDIFQHSTQMGLKVAYLTSEQFANQMVQALKTKKIEAFKDRFRNLDMLLLEDVHFFQGKEKMQEELLSLIKTLQDKGRKVVFTSTFMPQELNKVDSHLASYLSCGLMAPISKPDFELRLRLVENKAKRFHVHLPDKIRKIIASEIHSDIRQLESCIHNMALKARLLNQPVSVEMAREILKNYSRSGASPDMQTIIDCVCDAFTMPLEKLRSKTRKKQAVVARNTAFYLARKYTEMPLKDIGFHFNRRHSTVLKGITNTEREVRQDTLVGRQVKRIEERFDQ